MPQTRHISLPEETFDAIRYHNDPCVLLPWSAHIEKGDILSIRREIGIAENGEPIIDRFVTPLLRRVTRVRLQDGLKGKSGATYHLFAIEPLCDGNIKETTTETARRKIENRLRERYAVNAAEANVAAKTAVAETVATNRDVPVPAGTIAADGQASSAARKPKPKSLGEAFWQHLTGDRKIVIKLSSFADLPECIRKDIDTAIGRIFETGKAAGLAQAQGLC